jgi:hypothetical protein
VYWDEADDAAVALLACDGEPTEVATDKTEEATEPMEDATLDTADDADATTDEDGVVVLPVLPAFTPH